MPLDLAGRAPAPHEPPAAPTRRPELTVHFAIADDGWPVLFDRRPRGLPARREEDDDAS